MHKMWGGWMSLEERYQLNKKYPIRLSMLVHSIKTNLETAKNQLKADARKTRCVVLMLKLAGSDLSDLEYSIQKGIINELRVEFVR